MLRLDYLRAQKAKMPVDAAADYLHLHRHDVGPRRLAGPSNGCDALGRSSQGSPTRRLGREVCNHAEVVTAPDPVYGLVEDALAVADVEGGAVVGAAHEHVVDPSAQLPVPVLGRHQRILGCEGLAWLVGMRAPPGVPVTDAHASQGLPATPEAHAGRVGRRVEITGQVYMQVATLGDLLDGPSDDNSLQLALVLEGELPVGQMVYEQQQSHRLWDEDLHDNGPTGEVFSPRRHVEIRLPHLPQRPPARYGDALPILDVSAPAGLPVGLVGDVVARTEQVGHLVVTVANDRFLERHQVGLQLAEALDEHAPSSVPLPSPSPQVERRCAHPVARIGFLLHGEPPSRLLPRIHLAEA